MNAKNTVSNEHINSMMKWLMKGETSGIFFVVCVNIDEIILFTLHSVPSLLPFFDIIFTFFRIKFKIILIFTKEILFAHTFFLKNDDSRSLEIWWTKVQWLCKIVRKKLQKKSNKKKGNDRMLYHFNVSRRFLWQI